MKRGQRPVILYFGDLDPTGLKIPEVITEKLFERYDIEVHLVRAGLTVEHIKKHNLPHNPEAVKQTDTNFNWYVKKGFGEYGVELDALHPKDLIELIDSSVRKQLDIEDMIEQQNIQEQERLILKRLKLGFIDLCHQEGITI